MKVSLSLILFLAFSSSFAQTFDREKIGQLTVEEVLLRPTYVSEEVAGGTFNFGDSSFRVRWEKDKNISATIAIGSVLEKNLPVIYDKNEQEDDLGFYEAYADYKGLYGRIRAGLLTLNYGHYGSLLNLERIFPRPQIYTQRVIGLRDYGVSFYTSHNGYFTELIGHNGELDSKEQDGNIWTTARWGWSDDRRLAIQLSAQTGRTKPVSTVNGSNGATALAGWDNTASSLWRTGAFSIFWTPRRSEVVAQFFAGERVQGTTEGKMMSAQLELIHYFGDYWGLGFRHDEFDPNKNLDGDRQTQTSMLAFVKSADSSSLLSVILSKNIEEANERPNDQILVSWRLTPFVK